jgi:hypothetical protein
MRTFWQAGARLAGALAVAGTIGISAEALGTPPAGAAGPYSAGTIFVADQNCGYVNPNPAPGCLWEIPPGGSPQEFAYGYGENPQDVAVDAAGDLFWTESSDGAVRELTAGGTELTLASGVSPWGIATDGTHVWFGSFTGSRGQGVYEVPAGVANSTPAFVTGAFGVATSLAVDGNGDLWGAGGSDELFVVPAGSVIAFPLSLPSPASDANGVQLNAADDVFVSDAFGDSGAEFDPATGAVTTFGSGLGYTEGVAVDGTGDVFLGQTATVPGYGKIYKFSGGTQTLYAAGQLATTGGIAYWPPPAPAVRKTVTATVSTSAASTVTTETKVALTLTISPAVDGLVQFTDNGQSLGAPVHAKDGVAHLTVTLPAGSDTVAAGFAGNASRAPALASNSLTFTSNPITTKTVISTTSTSVPGDGLASVTATVTGRGGTPSGYVDIYDGKNYEAEGYLTAGRTTVQFRLPVGTSKVHAVYEGDSTFATSTSNMLTFTTVPPYTPTLTEKVTYTKIASSKSKTAIIMVHVIGVKGNGAPTGTVSADDGFTCGALTQPATGLTSSAVCTAVVPHGTDEWVTLDYSGSSTYAAATTSAYIENGGGD